MSLRTAILQALDPVELWKAIYHSEPDPWQAQVLRSDHSRIILNATRQGGKSTVVACKALHLGLYAPKSLILLVSRSLRQSSELGKKLFDSYRELGRPVPADGESKLVLELSNQSRIICLPGADEGSIRGYSGVRCLIIDEAARCPDALFIAVKPMVSVSGGSILLLSTPFGKRGFFHTTWSGAMDYILRPICRALHVNFISSIGFQSIGSAVKLLKRVQALGRICQGGKPMRVFHIADFDPAGTHMAAAIARQAEFWLHRYAPDADIKLTSLALSREQVVAYALPRIPIKDSDVRKDGFEERYGEGAVELDALEALRPGELARLVRKAIEPYRDPTLRDRLNDAADEAQELAEEAWDERLAPYREECDAIEQEVRRLVAPYTEDLQRLSDRLEEDLAPLDERAARLRQTVQEERERFVREVELPERPEPETDPIDEESWLYSSDRDYLTQLAMYKARKNGQASDAHTS